MKSLSLLSVLYLQILESYLYCCTFPSQNICFIQDVWVHKVTKSLALFGCYNRAEFCRVGVWIEHRIISLEADELVLFALHTTQKFELKGADFRVDWPSKAWLGNPLQDLKCIDLRVPCKTAQRIYRLQGGNIIPLLALRNPGAQPTATDRD